jgi:hypothetical protein
MGMLKNLAVTSVNVVEIADGHGVATAQAALGVMPPSQSADSPV